MIYILEIGSNGDGTKPGPRYLYNLWSVVEFEDGAVMKDARKIHTDSLAFFLDELAKRIEVPTIGE